MFQIGEYSKIIRILKPKELNDWPGYCYYTADQIDDFYEIDDDRKLC